MVRRDDDEEAPDRKRTRGDRPSRKTAVPTFGTYIVGELLGVGGMATVHRAEQVNPRRIVALERLLPNLAEDPEIVRSFVH